MLSPSREVVETSQVFTSRDAEGYQMLNQYRVGKLLGKGMHGKVKLGYDTINGQKVAIKMIKRRPVRPKLQPRSAENSTEAKIRREVAIMKKCRHEHVVRLFEVIDAPDSATIFLVLEYMDGGEVAWRTFDAKPLLTVEQSRRIFRDVVLGLEYLHYQGIIHRDIKPANLLWTANRQCVKISDFGVSHFSYALRLASAGKNQTEVDSPQIVLDEEGLARTAGSPAFYAPEMCLMNTASSPKDSSDPEGSRSPPLPPLTKAIDVWALGITLYSLLFGKPPFNAPTVFQLYARIPVDPLPVPSHMGAKPQRIQTQGDTEGDLVMSILYRLLEKDVNKRITLPDVKRLGWVLRGIEDPQAWLRATAPGQDDLVIITEDDTKGAFKPKRRTIARVTDALFKRPFTRPRSLTTSTVRPLPSPPLKPKSPHFSRKGSAKASSSKPRPPPIASPGGSGATIQPQAIKRSQGPLFPSAGPSNLFRRSSEQSSPPVHPALSPTPNSASLGGSIHHRSTPLLSPEGPNVASPSASPSPYMTNDELRKQQGETRAESSRTKKFREFIERTLLFRSSPNTQSSKHKKKLGPGGAERPQTDHEELGRPGRGRSKTLKARDISGTAQPIQRSASWGQNEGNAVGYDSSQFLGPATDDEARSYESSDDDIEDDIYGPDMAGAGGFGPHGLGMHVPNVFPTGTAARSSFGQTPQGYTSSSELSSPTLSLSKSGVGFFSHPPGPSAGNHPQQHAQAASTPSTSASSSSAGIVNPQSVIRVFTLPQEYQSRPHSTSPLARRDGDHEFLDREEMYSGQNREMRQHRSLPEPQSPSQFGDINTAVRRDSESDRFADAEADGDGDADSTLSRTQGPAQPQPQKSLPNHRPCEDDDDDDDNVVELRIKPKGSGSRSPI